jgi:hypothetical protein
MFRVVCERSSLVGRAVRGKFLDFTLWIGLGSPAVYLVFIYRRCQICCVGGF